MNKDIIYFVGCADIVKLFCRAMARNFNVQYPEEENRLDGNNLVAVKYCADCINCTSTLKGGQKCKLSKRAVKNDDYCSKYAACPDSLCWDCKNATGGCEWSQSFTPVDGWEAIPRTIRDDDSFLVIKCPKFEKG